MKLTKKHKIYLGVAAIGLVCLLVDRFALRGGAASADAAPPEAFIVKRDPAAPGATAAPAATPAPLAATPAPSPAHAQTSTNMHANPRTPASARQPANPKSPAEPASSSTSTAVIVERLKAVALAQELDESATEIDAFRPSPTWVPPKPDKSESPEGAPLETREQLFVRTHTLTAVVVGRNGFALVDGKLLRIGHELEGFRLISVDKRSATFAYAGNEGGGEKVTLPLVESAERKP